MKKIKGDNLGVSPFYNRPITHVHKDTSNTFTRYNNLEDIRLGLYAFPAFVSSKQETSNDKSNELLSGNKIMDAESEFRKDLMKTLLWKQADRYRGVSEPKFIF